MTNILFIIADDQRPDTIGPDSQFPVHTPNLDQLALEGTEFIRHYCTTPICTPARAEVLTGQHSYANQVRWFGQPIRPGLPLMPGILQEAGYHTIHVGKWHNDGHPRDKGYDVVRRAMHDSGLDYRQHGHTMEWEENGRKIRGHSTELFCDAAIEEVTNAPDSKPWFCYLALHSPHDPFQAPKEFLPKDMPLPNSFMPVHPYDNGDLTIRDELLLPIPRKPEAVCEYRRQYAGMIQHHDHHLGRIFDYLRNSGQIENTLIVFTSDHGLAVGDHGLLGKENMYEHSIRVPCVMRGPGIESAKTVHELTHHTDFLKAVKSATRSDGSPIEIDTHPFICCGFTSPDPQADKPLRETQRAIVTQNWKLVWYPHNDTLLLYHLTNDPAEVDNLLEPWRTIQYPLYGYTAPYSREDIHSTAADLIKKMTDWAVKNDDPLAGKMAELPNFFGP